MKVNSASQRRFVLIGTLLVALLTVWLVMQQPRQSIRAEDPGSAPEAIILGRGYLPGQEAGIPSNRHDSSRIDTMTTSIFGPGICTNYGDPFTPDNPWLERPYSYQYRVVIPADYEVESGSSILRIELFDPDSVNAPTSQSYTIIHTDIFSDANPTIGQIEPGSNGGDRRNARLEPTCEWDAQSCDGVTGFELDTINPFWLVRVDENRGVGAGNGNGSCGNPGTYTERYNTELQFRLRYFRHGSNGILADILLASYTGQTDDVARDVDSWSHNTDIAWSSPGGFNSLGYVPTDCGSVLGGYSLPGDDGNGDGFDDAGTRCQGLVHRPINVDGSSPAGFEIDLTTDIPNSYLDPNTGDRILYVEVQALSGASENNFMIWAGPPDYNVPADANVRNVYVINEDVMDPAGVRVENINTLNMNAMFSLAAELDLVTLDERYAGLTVTVSLFDPDSGTTPPITFFYDTMPQNEFSIEFDTQGCWGNGGCNNQWIGPPGNEATGFEIPVPFDFISGTLMANFEQGEHDTFLFAVELPELPLSPTNLMLSPASPTETIGYQGELVTLAVELSNEGLETAGGVVLSQTVPAGLTIESVAATGLVLYQPEAGVGYWQVEDIPAGHQGTFTVSLRVDPNLTEPILIHSFTLQAQNDATTGDDVVHHLVAFGNRTYLPTLFRRVVE